MYKGMDEWRKAFGGKVITILGPVDAEKMGITLPHEHLLIKHQIEPVNLTDPCLAANEIGKFRDAGGRTVIDLTNIGIGRDPTGLKMISEKSGVNIVIGSGYYKTAWLPPSWESADKEASGKSIGDITSEIVGDIIHGVNGTGIQAGIIAYTKSL